MGATVCCPSCWTWSEFKKSATCRRCGSVLIFPDGQPVAQVVMPAPPPVAAMGAVATAELPAAMPPGAFDAGSRPRASWQTRRADVPAATATQYQMRPTAATQVAEPAVAPPLTGSPPPPPAAGAGASAYTVISPPSALTVSPVQHVPDPVRAAMVTYSVPAARGGGFDWVAMARWVTIGYGAVAFLSVLAVGLLIRHVSVHVADPVTGQIVDQTFDIGAAMVFVAAIVAVVFALFAWLTQFVAARIVLLLLVVLGAVNALGRLADGSGSVVAASVASLVLDAAYAFVLVMSIVARPRQRF